MNQSIPLNRIDVQPISTYKPEALLDLFKDAIAQLNVRLLFTEDAFNLAMHPSVFMKMQTTRLSYIDETVASYLLKNSYPQITTCDRNQRMPADLVAIYTTQSIPEKVDPVLVFLGEYPPIYPLEILLMKGF